MKCERIQPDLLDYSKGMLSGPEARQVKRHLGECPACAALLEEEIAFANQLRALPEEEPANDVWALVRARTKPRRFSLSWFRQLTVLPVRIRQATAAAVTVGVVAVGILGYTSLQQPTKQVVSKPAPTSVAVKWSDDPIGNHTDAMVKFIDDM